MREGDAVRELSHTADIGFELRAGSLSGLFPLAAQALVAALGLRGGRIGGRPEPLALERPDAERLLVAWLRELLHRSTADRLVPEVRDVTVTPGPAGVRLEAHVLWREWAPGDGPEREIKGVTYHGLGIREADGAWHATVVLDV